MNTQLSYWEIKSWLSGIDFCIIGSGIVGLNCAIQLKKLYPRAKVLVLERGALPQGASTKNAGFACFGSVSELVTDLKSHSEEEVLDLVKFRLEGLKFMRVLLGDSSIGYQQKAGYEVFQTNEDFNNQHFEAIPYLNNLLKSLFPNPVFKLENERFGFKGFHKKVIKNTYEGQLDTGRMMFSLFQLARSKGIQVLNGVEVKKLSSNLNSVHIYSTEFDFKAKKVFIANNAFAKSLIDLPVKAVRNQVLVTEKIPNLKWNTCFHLEEGYYYFRAIDGRILIGGGRHLDPLTETTSAFGTTQLVESKLIQLLNTNILPGQHPKIDYRWSGILGIGEKKTPLVKQLDNHLYCGVRMGGMGVAIGSAVGLQLANLINQPPG